QPVRRLLVIRTLALDQGDRACQRRALAGAESAGEGRDVWRGGRHPFSLAAIHACDSSGRPPHLWRTGRMPARTEVRRSSNPIAMASPFLASPQGGSQQRAVAVDVLWSPGAW